jgi:L,D-transpeptidase ErfK/SrfK
VGDRWIHEVAPGETWQTIGARVGVDPRILAARNERSTRVALRPGDVLGIDNRHIAPEGIADGLVINLPQRMLFVYRQCAVSAAYPIAVGKPTWPTPLGAFTVIEMETDPTWDVPASIQNEIRRAGRPVVTRILPGPSNPLGKYWIRLSFGGIGVHGTNAPASIFQFATHGCIRLHPEDIEHLYRDVDVGEAGEIVYEPVLAAYDGTAAYLEVHADAYRRAGDPFLAAIERLDTLGLSERIDLSAVERVVHAAEGTAVLLPLQR